VTAVEKSTLVRRPGRPSGADIQRLNQHLLDTAERLFLGQGFEATSMDQVAEHACSSKRTIYHRYPSKCVLFEAVVDRAVGRLVDDDYEPAGSTIDDRLESLALRVIDLTLRLETLSLMRIVIAEALRFQKMAAFLDDRVRCRFVRFVARVLIQEEQDGSLTLSSPAPIAAQQFLNLTSSTFILRALLGGDVAQLRKEASELVRPAVRLFLNSSRPAAAP